MTNRTAPKTLIPLEAINDDDFIEALLGTDDEVVLSLIDRKAIAWVGDVIASSRGNSSPATFEEAPAAQVEEWRSGGDIPAAGTAVQNCRILDFQGSIQRETELAQAARDEFEYVRSGKEQSLVLLFPPGGWDGVPYEVRLAAPWVGSGFGAIASLGPADRWQYRTLGYAIVREWPAAPRRDEVKELAEHEFHCAAPKLKCGG
jgi:hypothetical protein